MLRTVGETRIDHALTNAGPEVTLSEVVGVQRQRHRTEALFEAGNGEAGLDHYEIRSWVGWHHHMTLALGALWFLCLERRRVGAKPPPSPCHRRGRCSRGCSAIHLRHTRPLPRKSPAYYCVMRNRGSITGIKRGGNYRLADRFQNRATTNTRPETATVGLCGGSLIFLSCRSGRAQPDTT